YQKIALRVRTLAIAGDQQTARDLYNTASRTAYDAASHTFDLLNASNVESPRQASLQSASAYRRAQWIVILTICLAIAAVASATVYVRRSISAPLLDLAARMPKLAGR